MKMKTSSFGSSALIQACLKPLAPLVAVALCPLAHAAITVPGADGSDGTLNITTDTVIDLSQAVTGTLDANNAANAGKGVYDPAKWAVVFKYTNVTVAPEVVLSFEYSTSLLPGTWQPVTPLNDSLLSYAGTQQTRRAVMAPTTLPTVFYRLKVVR